LLIEQRHHDVHWLDELVILADSKRLRVGERHLKFAGQFVRTHCDTPSRSPGSRNFHRNRL